MGPERGKVFLAGVAGWASVSRVGVESGVEEGAVQPIPRPGAGSGIGIIYKDAQKDYDDVRWATNEASAKALHTIQAEINTRAAGEVPLLVFNPLAWQRTALTTVDVEMPPQ